jgi:protein TonB
MNSNSQQKPFLTGFIILSVVLHLLLLYLLPQRGIFPIPDKKPVYVEVRDVPASRELDLPSPAEETPREEPAKRLGPADHKVEKETAPKGEMPEDRIPSALPARPQTPAPGKQPQQMAKSQAPSHALSRTIEPFGPGHFSTDQQKAETQEPQVPSQIDLGLAPATIARLEDDWRHKYREDVEEGNAVWLDTEKDILLSFFQRFRDNIYGVWNYPQHSAEWGEEGTCLIKATINRDGTVQSVRLMESSGYPALDNEAMAAVKKGAPYGKLPRAYQEETLNIFAFFQYNLFRQVIY